MTLDFIAISGADDLASLGALADMGLKVNVSVNEQGQYNVMGVLAGTF